MSADRPPGAVDRAEHVARLGSEQFDLAVVGGGISGCGIAFDAATRGLRVALVERNDFASGTSSRSTKLIHGGLRYLAQGQPMVTRQASIERSRLLRLAPSFVRSLPFVVPVTGPLDALLMKAALTAYDLLASFQNTHNHRGLGRRDLPQWSPALRGAAYVGGLMYYDGQTDDVRLTLGVLKEAVRYGACAVNHCAAVGFGGRPTVNRLLCRDGLSGAEFAVRAHRVVLACGVWVDHVLREGGRPHAALVRPAKGVHLVLPQAPFGSRAALLLRHPGDGRYIFVLPWKGRTLVGTTDTPYSGSLEEPPVTAGEVRYLLEAVRRRLPAAGVTEDDVLGVQAGLRPLVNVLHRATAAISREDRVTVGYGGMLTIVGGKLTTFRHMAQKVVDLAVALLRDDGVLRTMPRCRTLQVPLDGFPPGDDGDLARRDVLRQLRLRFPDDVAEHLLSAYGSGALRIDRLVSEQPELAERVTPELPVVMGEACYAVESELAMSLADVLTRRLGLSLLDPRGAVRRAADVARRLGGLLGWDEAEQARQVVAYREEAAHYTWA